MNMRFFNPQTIASSNQNIRQISINSVPLGFSMKNMRTNIQPIINQPLIQAIPTQPVVGKVKWGEPTWFLFHTLSCKIYEDSFLTIRYELLNNVYAICTNLPCPDCAAHAKSYLDGINFSTIKTKDDFKKLLFNFHNSVNLRKGYPLFEYTELDAKYNLAITNNIIVNFMSHFSDKSRSIKLLATDLHRSLLCEVLKKWFNSNIQHFSQ